MNSCRKGADGERKLASLLRDHGYVTERGGVDSFGERPDLSGLPGIHIECKRVERLDLAKAMDQSIRDAKKIRGRRADRISPQKPRPVARYDAL